MRTRQVTWAALAALLCSVTSFAATDAKEFHGGICVVDGFGPVGQLFTYSAGAYCNSDNCSVSCPLVRDKISDADTLVRSTVEVQNADSSYLNCTFNTMDEDGNSGFIYDGEIIGTTTTGPSQMVFGATLDASPGDEGSYFLSCQLGHGDMVNQIRLVETTDDGGTE